MEDVDVGGGCSPVRVRSRHERVRSPFSSHTIMPWNPAKYSGYTRSNSIDLSIESQNELM
jgi:hypothetical protein